jgi:DUF1009 family protein
MDDTSKLRHSCEENTCRDLILAGPITLQLSFEDVGSMDGRSMTIAEVLRSVARGDEG